MKKRGLLLGGAAAAVTAAIGGRLLIGNSQPPHSPKVENPVENETILSTGMKLRDFGSTGMKVSEVGFGAWGIGGQAYGTADREESLRALARAEELGCNFVDTAAVYGDSEAILGEFLRDRRSRWLISTKYSAQPQGVQKTIEDQLRRLGTDTIDFYMIHWSPGKDEHELYEDLYRLKKSGKARAVGVSLKTVRQIDYVLDETEIDGFMVRLSLLDPEPYLSRLHRFREKRPAIIVRSALKEGFLTGKYQRDATFDDPNDQRSEWSRDKIAETVDAVERFRFLEKETGSMVVAAARYPLSFPETSTVVLGTRAVGHADSNFGLVSQAHLSAESQERINKIQRDMGLRSTRQLMMERIRHLLGGD